MNLEKKSLSIDIEKVLKSKGVNKAPRFLVSFLKRIIHQDELNELLEQTAGLEGVDFATKALEILNITFTLHGEENLPPVGEKFVFASNHPLGGLDGLMLISILGKRYDGKVKFVVNDLLMHVTPLEPTFIPINKHGKMSSGYARKIQNAFDSEAQILYFPAGLCSRLINGKIIDLPWKKTFVSKAIESHRGIVPIHFSGKNSMFFYRLAKLRKFLRIKFNIEMIFLVDEMFKQKNNSFDIYIREPLPADSLTQEKTYSEWTQIIRNKSYGTDNQSR